MNAYTSLLQKVHEHAATIKRNCDDIHVIAVSKTFQAEHLLTFYQEGVRDFGENYIQEWEDKRKKLPDDIIWHIIGDVQSNKTVFVAKSAHWVHSISRLKIAKRLSEQRSIDMPPLQVCLEVNISGSSTKHGVRTEEVFQLAQQVDQLPNLNLRGLMCVPQAQDEQMIRAQMQEAQNLFTLLQRQYSSCDTLSMGMSGDWQWALEYGATHLRIGSALMGCRT